MSNEQFAAMKLAMINQAFEDLLAHVLAAGDAQSAELDAVGAWFFDLGDTHT